jgi:hypothetical protein
MNDAKNSVVAIYKTPVLAEIAIRKMEYAELDLHEVSLLWRHPPAADRHGSPATEVRLNRRGQPASVTAEIQGALSSSACFLIPGLGEVFVAGPLVEQIAGELASVPLAAGLTSLGTSLFQLGLSKDSILQYEAELRAGKGMVLAHGAPKALVRVREMLAQTQPDTLADHQSVRAQDECHPAGRFFPARPIYVAPNALPKTLLPSR